MGLRDLTLPTTTVSVPGGGSFSVGGLSFDHITKLAANHAATAAMLFEQYVRKADEMQPGDIAALASIFRELAPELVGEVIAMASGDDHPDAVKMAGRLPLPVQIQAVEAIITQTFATEGDLKKVLEAVIRGANTATSTVQSLTTVSP